MKYSLVTETFPPEINGVARTLERLVRGIAELGHTAEVIRPKQSRSDTPRTEPYSELLVPSCPIPRYPGLKFGLPVYWRLKKHWAHTRPDRIHVATEGPLGVAAILAARSLKIPVYSSFHTNFHSYGTHYGYGFLMNAVFAYLRWVHNLTLGTFAPSEDVCEHLRKHDVAFVYGMARGVDTALFNPQRRSEALRAEWGVSPEDPVMLYVGRVSGEKNFPLLIRSYEAMRKKEPRLKLVVVGEGPMRPKLEHSHPELVFVGAKVGEELATHYASGDLFVFASVSETFGNVVTEAMASGLVVLAYHYAAPQKHIVNAQNGFTVPLHDEAAFEAAAVSLLDKRRDWPALQKAATTTAQGLSWESIINEYWAVVEQGI